MVAWICSSLECGLLCLRYLVVVSFELLFGFSSFDERYDIEACAYTHQGEVTLDPPQ